MRLGILSAMPEEATGLEALVRNARASERAGRRYVAGSLGETEVVIAFSRWGKVAAASTATELILAHGVERMVFSGIAGSLSPHLRIGDVVVAERLFQHDLDASPFFLPTVIPLLGVGGIPADPTLSDALAAAATEYLAGELARGAERPVTFRNARVHRGDIASGDQVISTEAGRRAVLARVPSALCVEMEGAAAAQVCFEHAIPFACVRTVSDGADEGVGASLAEMLSGAAAAYTVGIMKRLLGVRE